MLESALGRTRTYWPAFVGAVVAWVVAAYALTRPFALKGVHSYSGTGYDDGVYLGSAVRLLRGSLPWQDFDFAHPPGITWLMTPVALVGEFTSTQDALAVARIATLLVAGANAFLAGAVVRSRGRLAMLTASLVMASFPTAVAATHTLMLEPYLVFFCLLGAVLLLHDGALASGRRLLLAGAATGFACSVKVWAILVVLAVAVALWPRVRDLGRWAAGLSLGFLVPTLPLAVLAPRTFLHDVVVAQLTRGTAGIAEYSFGQRLPLMLGLEIFPTESGMATARLLAAMLAAFLVVMFLAAVALRTATRLDVFAIVALGLVVLGMTRPPQFYDHYAYFMAAFVAVAVGLAVATAVTVAERAVASDSRVWARRWRTAAVGVASLAMVAGACWALPGNLDRAEAYVAEASDPGEVIRSVVPPGSCVVTDMVSVLQVADRYAASPACKAPLDPFGLWLTDNVGNPPSSPPPYEPAFVERWRAWLQSADYVVLTVPFSNYIPWTDELIAWFNTAYVLVAEADRTYVYQRLAPA